MPHNADGIRTEPAPSEPCATGPSPAATDAPAPPDDAPEVRSSFQGFLHGSPRKLSHMSLYPKCGVLVFPRMTAPALRRRSVATPSSVAMLFSDHFEPNVQ